MRADSLTRPAAGRIAVLLVFHAGLLAGRPARATPDPSTWVRVTPLGDQCDQLFLS